MGCGETEIAGKPEDNKIRQMQLKNFKMLRVAVWVSMGDHTKVNILI